MSPLGRLDDFLLDTGLEKAPLKKEMGTSTKSMPVRPTAMPPSGVALPTGVGQQVGALERPRHSLSLSSFRTEVLRFFRFVGSLFPAPPAPTPVLQVPLLQEVDADGLRMIEETSRPINVDLVSVLYPSRPLTPNSLMEALQKKIREAGSVIVFHADQKDAEKFRGQLQTALAELNKSGATRELGQPVCFFKVDPDIDHAALTRHLDRTVGPGLVTDADLERVALAWDDEKNR